MSSPVSLLKSWLNEEKSAGVINPQQAILATVSPDGYPHARVIAIREIKKDKIVFFTQKKTQKVKDISNNAVVSLVFWFEHYQRQVVIEGLANALSFTENEVFWKSYPREAQIRFCAYAPTSNSIIESKALLEEKRIAIKQQYKDICIPMSNHYLGFEISYQKFKFYAYRLDELSDVFQFTIKNNNWYKEILSP